MRKIFRKASAIVLLAIIWFIANEGRLYGEFGIGVFVAMACILIANRLLGFDYVETFAMPFWKTMKYFLFLIKEIYVSGCKVSYQILTGKASPQFVEEKIDIRVKNTFMHYVIGNSITMTPGTITVVNMDHEIIILSLGQVEKGERITASFENFWIEEESI